MIVHLPDEIAEHFENAKGDFELMWAGADDELKTKIRTVMVTDNQIEAGVILGNLPSKWITVLQVWLLYGFQIMNAEIEK